MREINNDWKTYRASNTAALLKAYHDHDNNDANALNAYKERLSDLELAQNAFEVDQVNLRKAFNAQRNAVPDAIDTKMIGTLNTSFDSNTVAALQVQVNKLKRALQSDRSKSSSPANCSNSNQPIVLGQDGKPYHWPKAKSYCSTHGVVRKGHNSGNCKNPGE